MRMKVEVSQSQEALKLFRDMSLDNEAMVEHFRQLTKLGEQNAIRNNKRINLTTQNNTSEEGAKDNA